jgi:hypothetical protein
MRCGVVTTATGFISQQSATVEVFYLSGENPFSLQFSLLLGVVSLVFVWMWCKTNLVAMF